MNLIIGGYAQGKLTYALTKGEAAVIDETSYGEFCVETIQSGRRLIVNHLHLICKSMLAEGREPQQWVNSLIAACREQGISLTFIADELGNGIVPMERSDREYRESVGRLLCQIAAVADSVERVICQLPQKLK